MKKNDTFNFPGSDEFESDVSFGFRLDEDYDAPETDYDIPADDYDIPADGYDVPEDSYDEPENGYNDGYDEIYDDELPLTKKEQKAWERARRQEQREQKQPENARGRNREILAVMYSFVFLFLATIGYFIYFGAVGSKDVINHPGNVHIAKLQEKNIRGAIKASDGTVLAQTLVDEAGNESRYYPYGSVFAHVVGTTGSNKSGLEYSFENYLLSSNINGIKRAVNELKNEKNPGDQVLTTLDLYLQQVAYTALGNNQGAVVAIEPSTGKVLAMVSKPDYDPNTLEANYQAIISDPTSKVLLNQATQGMFTPGSIFKICTTLEYIRENPDYDSYSYTCSGSIDMSDGKGGEHSLACYHNTVHGTQNLTASFANSCNASFANLGLTLDKEKMNKLADAMLFNQKLPTSIPHIKSSFGLNADDSDWLTGATAIGQGNTTMTPLHAAMIVSAVANGGVLMEPYLVERIETSDGGTVKKFMPKSYGSLMSAKEAAILTELMQATVTSGTAASLSGMGYNIAGKTGTAEIDNRGNNAWFVGFAPADDPQIAICVLVEDSQMSSSSVAVPIASQLFYAYMTTHKN